MYQRLVRVDVHCNSYLWPRL